MKMQPFVIWINGLSGAGKTTLAWAIYRILTDLDYKVKVLDGDTLRQGLSSNLGFSLQDRQENIRRTAEVNKLFLEEGFIVVNSFITPTEVIRSVAREIIGQYRLFEIYLSTPLNVCRQRDPKGLYKQLREGKIKEMTGIQSTFEPCKRADLIIDTSGKTVDECTAVICKAIQKRFLSANVNNMPDSSLLK